MTRLLRVFILYFYALNSHAWNMQGHQVIAQIAFDNLTSEAQSFCQTYLKPRSADTLNTRFLAAAVWLDAIRFKNIHWYDSFHYIDIPFSEDNTELPAVEKTNIVWGLNNALSILRSKRSQKADKRFALLVLIHLMGDVHQPLHAVTRISARLKKGDRGGNLFPLAANKVGNNLHQYWDNGAGFYLGTKKQENIRAKAKIIEKKWPCTQLMMSNNTYSWANDSYELALTQAYQLTENEYPSSKYQKNAQNTVQKQSALAGCRLAALLNKLTSEGMLIATKNT